jgi:hypothetical protein
MFIIDLYFEVLVCIGDRKRYRGIQSFDRLILIFHFLLHFIMIFIVIGGTYN